MRWLGLPASALILTACAQAVTGSATSPSRDPNSQPAAVPASAPPVPNESGPETTAGRPRAELLRDTDFRTAFEDVKRLRIATEFEELKFGLLRVTLGPGFATVSSARYNLERLYTTYRVASYRSEDTVIELWQNGSKIGEVTMTGVLVGSEFARPR